MTLLTGSLYLIHNQVHALQSQVNCKAHRIANFLREEMLLFPYKYICNQHVNMHIPLLNKHAYTKALSNAKE